MSTTTEIPAGAPTITMTRLYDAPRDLVWQTMTEPEHVRLWWGGPGCSSPVCEMDVRPGGAWRHVLRFPNGHELHLNFVFLEVERPKRLCWRHADATEPQPGPTPEFTATLEDLGDSTRCILLARFRSLADRDAAVVHGFTGPLEASHDRLARHLQTFAKEQAQ
jgi:uncharacterized protein YndB with AHSA1/START domain